MKLKLVYWVMAFSALLAVHSSAATLYVNVNGTNPIAPFADWSTAATNIQDAIDASQDGDQIWVTNGIYQNGGRVLADTVTNRVALTKAISVTSVNGPFVTIIQGAGATNGPAAVRCAWLTNGASLTGFTLQGGATHTTGNQTASMSGGAVWCASSNATVANCVIVSNLATFQGGAVYQGTVKSSLIAGNAALPHGGAKIYDATLQNCTVVSNASFSVTGCTLTNCIVYYNGVDNFGNGTWAYCCTQPLPGGLGNFTNLPQLFVDGIHLGTGSPCIGAGTSAAEATDLFGQAWSNPPSIGCAEFRPAPIALSLKLTLTGGPVGFTVGSSGINGQQPLSFQWLKDRIPLADNGHFISSQNTNLIAIGVGFTDAGAYQLVVTNAFGAVTSSVAQVVVHCVDAAGTNPVAPFTTWATAATNIQDAITASAAGEVVVVTNGLYASGGKSMDGVSTNRVTLDKGITVTSANGCTVTTIQGAWDPISTNGPASVRCAWLTNGAVLCGFTLENGSTPGPGAFPGGQSSASGGGVWCEGTNGTTANCVLTNNVAYSGGGVAFGILNNSLVTMNLAQLGGGAYFTRMNNCTVVNNYAASYFISNQGAGAYGGIVANSIVYGNYDGPGGVQSDNYPRTYPPQFFYSCTSPPVSGNGNLNVFPQFLDLFHIGVTSPLHGAGSAVYASGTDLDGEPWANPPSVGCDEVVISNLVGPLSVSASAYQPNVLINRNDFFQGYFNGRVTQVVWSFENGSSITNSGTALKKWPSPGEYTATFTAFNLDNPGGVSTNFDVFVVEPTAPSIFGAGMQGTNFAFQFTGQTNVNYTVQYATNLAPPILWQAYQSFFPSQGQAYQIMDPSTNDARFYRVLAQ